MKIVNTIIGKILEVCQTQLFKIKPNQFFFFKGELEPN